MMGHWKIASGKIVGRYHMKREIPCQDSTYCISENGITVATLADGAGSCARSHEGAAIATKRCAQVLTERFTDFIEMTEQEIVEVMLDEIVTAIRNHDPATISLKPFSSTLLFVAVDGEYFLAGHLGDGVIGCQEEENHRVLSFPENGEFTNATFFTTSVDAHHHFRIYREKINQKRGFILMSDGSAESLFHRQEKTIADGAKKMMGWLAQYPAEVVEEAIQRNLENVIRDRTYDDCAIALLQLSLEEDVGIEGR
jgi:serine/threonine protein phosphatase PrpC